MKLFTANPFAPFRQPLKDFGLHAGNLLLLICPQLCLSAVALFFYTHQGMFPARAIGLHLIMIGLVQIIFFWLWAQLLKIPHQSLSPWLRHTYSFSLLAKGLALNFVYAISFISFHFWHYYLSWDNLRVSLQDLDGFYQSLGWIVPVTLLALAVFLIGLYIFYHRLSPRFLTSIDRALNGPAAQKHAVIFTATLLLLAFLAWNNEPNTAHFIPQDPLLSFWGNFPMAAKEAALTPGMLALHLARDFKPPAKFAKKNVIIITIDCLRRDHLSAYGYERNTTPFINQLIATDHAQLLPFALSNATYSSRGKRSILGSRLPHDQLLYDFKIQDALKRAGYRTYLVTAGDNTSLGGMRKHYGPNFDLFYDGVTPGRFSVNDDRRVLDGLEQVPPYNGRPAFFYFHFMSAHGLGLRLPEYQQWTPSALVLDWVPLLTGHYDPELTRNTYDNGVFQADHYLAEAFAVLKAKGYLDNYVGVFTGDHGESLGERGNFGHLGFLYMEGIGIPMIFLGSDKPDLGALTLGSQIDIAPTLLTELGLKPPAQWKGQSLFHATPPEALFSESRRNGEDWRTVVRKFDADLYQYIRISSPPAADREMLFDLTTDPGAKTNLSDDPNRGETLAVLRHLVDRQFQSEDQDPD